MQLKDTKEYQLSVLREFMKMNGYQLVYTDNSVFFRAIPGFYAIRATARGKVRIGFATAVRMYRERMIRILLATGEHDLLIWAFYPIYRINLQQSRNDIICTSHLVKFTPGSSINQEELLDSLPNL